PAPLNGRIFNARLRSMAEYSMPGSAQWPNIQCPAPLNSQTFVKKISVIERSRNADSSNIIIFNYFPIT
ncbi:MAG: hypothetical protein K9H12_09520, partial [Bacteroidales bacterium]|nr:hypothetical protein [Bacteroidales bacterium]